VVENPLIVLAGPTAGGKSCLALALAEAFSAEIVSCDSIAVYRQMDIGSAKPSPADRARIPHHLLDVVFPSEPFTAGDYSRQARSALADIAARKRLPIVAGGTGLYLRALLDGLFPAPPTDLALRERLRKRPPTHLHRILTRLDPAAAQRIHPNDAPKLVRAVEVSLAARRPITGQWQAGRDALAGYRILRLGLAPPRPALYARIDQRAAAMFSQANNGGLLEETRNLLDRYGPQRPFTSLGYAQAWAVLRHEISLPEAIRQAQQGHRNYAKRQTTWFRKEAELHPVHWLPGTGDGPAILRQAVEIVEQFLTTEVGPPDHPPA
jgi:tRNA dimethylallyltransferase